MRVPAAGSARPEHRRERPPHFTLELRRSPTTGTTSAAAVAASSRRSPFPFSYGDLHTVIDRCPQLPFRHVVHPTGPVAATLLYFRPLDALGASEFFWLCRLSGDQSFTPHLYPSPPDVERRLRRIFSIYIDSLLEGELARRFKCRIQDTILEAKKLAKELQKPRRVPAFEEINGKLQQLEADIQLMARKLEEFKAAIRCLVASVRGERKPASGVENGEVDLFRLGDEMDWNRVACIVERECRRLEDGLPIYAARRTILNLMSSNQVVVLIGETGSGKSTQVVQFLADSGLASDRSIVCTQPRKIAAISLARRVDEETNGCYTEKSVTCNSTFASAQGFGSGLIFMTDHCLLQHCLTNNTLFGISCIVVDEAHERSLNTDLLLAFLKKILTERHDLRVIIMSATADASKLSEYFCGCPALYVKGRNFPVEIKYVPDVSAEASFPTIPQRIPGNLDSYVYNVIKIVSVIHKTEEDGAILAFLTSQMEVEWACENFTDPSAEVLPMHGKLSWEEQSRVFRTFPGKRKVIFSTNVAETSLTIKVVKFVVDSGKVKDSMFDPSSGMNILKVGMISQSSANQRAGRAGRTEPGKCFRLYSESDFQSMKTHQEPEIHKVHLGVAVLRILASGIMNMQDFEFVDSPSPEAIEKALKNLIHLSAIVHRNNVFELTDTGRNLVKLGIEPRLGKIILDCLVLGLRKEGLVLAAVMANGSSIFCRVGSDVEKLKADCLKVPFCHRDGDLFTLLSVYKQWEAEHESKNKWCWQNSINAKSMRRCQETVTELESCLLHDLNVAIPKQWSWNPYKPTVHDQSLKKVILSSLAENIAMYSGHDRFGYEVALTGQRLQLHPSCSLQVFDEKPSWVVFSEILSTSKQYLVCVTAFDHELLYKIEPPLFDVSQLESNKMHMNVITGIGGKLARRLCGRQNCNLQYIVKCTREACSDDRIDIDVDFNKREIHLIASKIDLEKVYGIVSEAVRCEAKWLRDECTEKYLYHGGPGISSPVALFGSGAEIKHIELEKRYLDVDVSHPNANNLNDKEVLSRIDQYAPGIANYCKLSGSVQDVADSNKWGKITYLCHEAAQNAVAKLNEVDIRGSLLIVHPVRTDDHRRLPFSAVRGKVTWPRRLSKRVALVKCDLEDADVIASDCSGLVIGNRYINCRVSTKNRDRVLVRGLPKDTTEPDLYRALLSATKRRILGIEMLREKDAVKHPPSLACTEALSKEIAPFMPSKHLQSNNFWVEVFNPEPEDHWMKAMITFDGGLHLEAAKALDHIQGKVLPGCLPWQKMHCQHVFHTSVCCPPRAYSVLRKQLDSLLEDFKLHNGVAHKIESNNNGSIRVRIFANGTRTAAELRKPLEQLLKGRTLNNPSLTPIMLELLFSHEGKALKTALEWETGTYILFDRRNLTVKLFGPPNEVALAEEKLVEALISHHENKPLEIHLRGRNLPLNLMKEVVQRFGADLQGLKEMVSGAEVVLNTRCHVLYVRGNKEQKQKVETMISELARSLTCVDVSLCELRQDASCPICLCEQDGPYKLEDCGHDFCRSCLVDQFESAIRSREGFPLCCTKEGCTSKIVLADLKSLLPADKVDELFRASLGAFVAASGGAYRFCPTPDCPAVYKVPPRDAKMGAFVCDACSAETCTKCHLEYHPFLSCEAYKRCKDDPDLSLEEWRRGKTDVKDCPSCGQTIEKAEGCNHVACRCGRDICWVCLELFDSSNECYSHLRLVHQSIN